MTQETFQQLWEDCTGIVINRSQKIRDYCQWRADDPALRHLPLADYLERMRFLRQNIQRAQSRNYGWHNTITEWHCYHQGHKQQWLCALTGEPLSFARGGQEFNGQTANPKSCSIDRIDPHEGYNANNIQLVTWEANLLKRNFTMQELTRLAKSLVVHLKV
jgi:hypothetical protein